MKRKTKVLIENMSIGLTPLEKKNNNEQQFYSMNNHNRLIPRFNGLGLSHTSHISEPVSLTGLLRKVQSSQDHGEWRGSRCSIRLKTRKNKKRFHHITLQCSQIVFQFKIFSDGCIIHSIEFFFFLDKNFNSIKIDSHDFHLLVILVGDMKDLSIDQFPYRSNGINHVLVHELKTN